MIERKRLLGMLGSGLIGMLFVNPFKEERTWIWFKLYDYSGNYKGWELIDTTDWVHQPNMSEGLGYSRLVTPDGTYVPDQPNVKYESDVAYNMQPPNEHLSVMTVFRGAVYRS